MSSHIQQHQQEQHQQSSSYFVQYLFHLLWNVEEFRERVVSDQRGHVCTGIQKRNGEVKRSQKLPIGSNFNSQESVQKQGNGRLEEDEIPLELVHGSSKCIYCSLKESFIQLDKGKQKEQSFLDGVEGLDDLIKNEQFGLEKLNYDVEIYKALIDSLHFAIQGEMTKAQGCFPPCMVHNLLSLCIQPVPNSPLYFNNAFHSISVEELLKLEDFEKGSSSKLKDLSFKKLQNKIQAKLQAKNSNSFTKIKDYDEKEGEEEEDKSSNDGSEDDTDAETLSRGKKLSFSQLIQKVSHKNDSTSSPCLLNRPKLLTLRFIWDNTETSIIEFNTLWDLLSPVLNLDDIFSLDNEMNQNQSMKSKDENEKQPMILRGIICYDQNHSISFSYNLKTSEWYSLDNDTIKIIGTNWGDLMRSYPLGSLQPSLLFYHPCSKEVARNEKMKYFQDKSLANPFIISNGNFKEHNRMSIIPQYSQHIDDANETDLLNDRKDEEAGSLKEEEPKRTKADRPPILPLDYSATARTLAAWQRTSASLMITGLAISKILAVPRLEVGFILCALGFIYFINATYHYKRLLYHYHTDSLYIVNNRMIMFTSITTLLCTIAIFLMMFHID